LTYEKGKNKLESSYAAKEDRNIAIVKNYTIENDMENHNTCTGL